MKGHGWRCDHCDHTTVIPGDPFVAGRQDPPTGWYALIGPFMGQDSPEAWHVNERHFCSVDCIAAASAEQVA